MRAPVELTAPDMLSATNIARTSPSCLRAHSATWPRKAKIMQMRLAVCRDEAFS